MSANEWRAWMRLLHTIFDPTGEALACPHCGAKAVDHRFFAGALRLGWGAVWCDACHHGVHLSRVVVPNGIDAEPMSSEIAIPRFEVVTPA